jgi:hypothetical protein
MTVNDRDTGELSIKPPHCTLSGAVRQVQNTNNIINNNNGYFRNSKTIGCALQIIYLLTKEHKINISIQATRNTAV